MNLLLDNWNGTTSHDLVVEDPSFADVRAFLEKLNGENHTLLALELASGATMHVGGGPGSYMSQSINGEFCWLAHGSGSSEGELRLVVGGQESLFDVSARLSREEVFDVLSVFYHGDGVLTTNVRWEVA